MGKNETRCFWLDCMLRIANPVLAALAKKELNKTMPLDFHPDKSCYAPLEAFGRTMCGIAPWLELEGLSGDEEELRRNTLLLALHSIDVATDPDSPDYMNWGQIGNQPLVDAAFFAHALVRAPKQLAGALPAGVRSNVIACLKKTRSITCAGNNWIFFTAMVEAALYLLGESDYDKMRIGYAVETFVDGWYHGDGVYGDGKRFHWDYYNSFVIQPMLVDLIVLFEHSSERYAGMKPAVLARAGRYAAILERMIAPDGTYPVIGRSITYRFGAFQMLSQAALEHLLPGDVKPAQVRCALTATIRRVMQAETMFDRGGWLLPGVYGYQPGLAEGYISNGSPYLCSAVFLALGLPPDDEFWAGGDEPWTSAKIWSGMDVPADHAIGD